jgi:hypothetical protein
MQKYQNMQAVRRSAMDWLRTDNGPLNAKMCADAVFMDLGKLIRWLEAKCAKGVE